VTAPYPARGAAAALLTLGVAHAAVTVQGTVTYRDRLYNTSGFTGATQDKPVRFAAYQVETTAGAILAQGTTGGNGTFSVLVSALNTGQQFQLRLLAVSQAAKVTTGGGIRNTVFPNRTATASTTNLGTMTITAEAATFNILDVCIEGFQHVDTHLARQLGQVDVLWFPGSTDGTYYVNSSIHLLGTASDPDEFDDDVILHEYGHFVAATISTVSQFSFGGHAFTEVVHKDLAFSEGFAHYFLTAVHGAPTYCDSNGSTCGITWNLEGPTPFADTLSTEAGVAASLWDLIDGINENFDFYENGQAAALQVLDSMDSTAYLNDKDLADYYDRWGAVRSDRNRITSVFTHYRIINGDTVSPSITHSPVTVAGTSQTIPITATITDNTAVDTAILFYRVTGAASYTPLTMARSGSTFTQSIPGSAVTAAGVEYYLEARDAASNWRRAPDSTATPPSRYTVSVSAGPGTPGNPAPANGAAGVSTTPALSWSAGSGATSHDVYFGTSPSPPLVTNTTGTSHNPGALAAGATYFWRIVAKNSSGSTTSPTWTFSTQGGALPPGAPANPSPANGATAVPLAATLSWTSGSGATSHDVYFGTTSSPPLITNTAGTTYSPAALNPGVTYFWRIVARNTGGFTSSPTWTFTSAAGTVSNDEPSGATLITALPANLTQATQTATSGAADPGHSCTFRTDSNTVWFRYTADFTGSLDISTAGSSYDTVLTVYSVSPVASSEIGCNDDSGGLQSALRISVTAGTTYYIEASAFGQPGGGTLTLSVSRVGPTCTYSLTPGPNSVTVTAPAGCAWTAVSNAAWITITGGASGSGNGTVTYTVAPNPNPSPRSGTITIAGQTIAIEQAGVSCTYSLTPASASPSSAGGAASFTVNTPAGCGWTAAPNAAWITISSGASGSGPGTVNYSVAANGASTQRSGAIVVAGVSFAITQQGAGTVVNPIPSTGVPNPQAGSGSTRAFTFTFNDANGASDLFVLNVLINNAIEGRNSCYLAYLPSGPASGTLVLVNDAGDAGGPFAGTLALPGSGIIANSQCSVNGAGSSASMSGNTLTLTLNMTFAAGYSGNRVVYAAARDLGGNNSGWHAKGVWNVPGAAPQPTRVTSLSPSSASSSTVTLTAQFADDTGFGDLSVLNLLIHDAIDGRNACYVAFVQSIGTLVLVNNAGDAGGPFAGAVTIPGTGTAANSQCTIAAAQSSVSGAGNTLTLTLRITFAGSFAGDRIVYAAARDNSGNNSGWQALGTISVP
jgi:hypothetical protein